jgi:DNA-binding HxlR family transcriptional regulator
VLCGENPSRWTVTLGLQVTIRQRRRKGWYTDREMPRVTTLRTALNGKAKRHPRSRCPVSCTLDLVGDRWSLLVIRDLMRGKRRFGEFLQSPESIPTNILTERLKRLVHAGIIASRRYCSHPPRMEYELTARGEDLKPVVRAMVEWGVRHAGGRLPCPRRPRVPNRFPPHARVRNARKPRTGGHGRVTAR